jgi:ABC-2 type transport system permease protein
MLAKTDLKMRYEGSWLGIIWVFLKPFSNFLVINFVFSTIFKSQEKNYSINLLIGLILFSFFQDSTTNGMASFTNKAHILKKIYIDKWTIIIASTIHSAIAFFFNLIILFIFLMGYYRIFPSPLYILIFLYYALLLYGITVIFSFIAAPLYVRMRDMNQIWEVLLQVLMFASPILYPITNIPYPIRSVLYANPLTYILEHSRFALVENSVSHWDHHLIFLCIFIPAFIGSYFFLKRFSRNLIEHI